MSLGRNTKTKKQEREDTLSECVNKSVPQELDVVDKGDHLKVVSCGSRDLAAWWMGALKAAYPQDHYSDSGDNLKMHPAMGVTLKLNRNDGTLKIKGKKHMDWFKENFEQVIESGNKSLGKISEMSRTINRYLKLDDGYTLPEILDHLPVAGAIKHGPSYVYRLWKGLLDQWISTDGDIYVVSPLFDAKRIADILLLLVKHKSSQSKVLIHTMSRCDGDTKFPKVYKHARHMLKTLKNPNTGKKLIVDERLNQALKRVDSKFGGFHLKLIACVRNETTELLLTSANFHNWHFHYDHSDMVVYFRMPTDDFRESYLEPLGLVAHKFGSLPLMPRDASSSSNASDSGSIHSPSNTSAQAFPALNTEGGSNKQQQQQQQNGVAGDVSNSSSGTTTPTTTPRSVTPRSSNRPTPSHTPKQQRVTLVTLPIGDRVSNSTLTNANSPNEPPPPPPQNTEVAIINHVDHVDHQPVDPPTKITKKTTTYETEPGHQITKTTTTYETTRTFTGNSLDRKRATPSPHPGDIPPAPPLPMAAYNESDDSVDIAIQPYAQVPRRQYQEVAQPHSNTSTLSRQSDGSRSFHEDLPQSYTQQATLPGARDEYRAHSYHGPPAGGVGVVTYHHEAPPPRAYRQEMSRSYTEGHHHPPPPTRQADPVFTEVRTANTKRTMPIAPEAGRTQEQSSVLQRANPVSPFYTELQQVKMRQGPRDQFSHSFEKRMSNLEESSAPYNENAPEPEPPSQGPTVHPIYSEVKRKKKSPPIETPVPPPAPPVHVETRSKTTYIMHDDPPQDQITVREERVARPVTPAPEVPETYKAIKARQQKEPSPPREPQEVSAPPPPPPPILQEDDLQEQVPYDPQLRRDRSQSRERGSSRSSQSRRDYTTPERGRSVERGSSQTKVVTPPFSLPLSTEREEIIAHSERRHQRVVSPPPGPRFSPTYEQSPPPPPPPQNDSPRSPTVDYTEVPIYPNIKPSHQNVTSSPRRVPSQPHEPTSPTTNDQSPPVTPPILKSDDSTYQRKPIRSLHPSITTTTTTQDITRHSPESRQYAERDSRTPVRHSYAYTEMTPAEAQSLYANMTKPETTKAEPEVQEVKTTRHRIEVTRVTHIDTTNVRPYDKPDISTIRFADGDRQPTESHM